MRSARPFLSDGLDRRGRETGRLSLTAAPSVLQPPAKANANGVAVFLFSGVLSLTLLPGNSVAGPMSYLSGAGTRALHTIPLLWAMIIVSLLVIAIASIALLGGIFRSREAVSPAQRGTWIEWRPGGLHWLYYGLGISALVLLGTMIWTVITLAAASVPPTEPKVKLEVVGHQWWWEVRYLSPDPSRLFSTANEIHIPVGEPVEISLRAADVIHSFWVPKIAGKTDLIPGQTNKAWVAAEKPGVYRGQCGEYCGRQHAHMALFLIATPRKEFEAWWDHMLSSTKPPKTEPEIAAETVFIAKCGVCHTVRGTRAGGFLGPELTHLMTRHTIAAGTLPNDIGHLSGWVADPQGIKPGALMPRLDISGPQLAQLREFLKRLD